MISREKKYLNNFVTLPKAILKDKSLSWKAKGIWAYLMSLPENWQINTRELASHSGDGYKSTLSGLKELEEHGYAQYTQNKGDKGHWMSGDWIVYDVKKEITETPQRKRRDGNPVKANPLKGSQLKNKENKEGINKEIKNISIADPSKNEYERSQMKAAPSLQARKDIFFDLSINKFKNITNEDMESWKELYPSVDLKKELLAMSQWLLSNPSKSKKKLWRKFITNWFQTAENRCFNKKAVQDRGKYESDAEKNRRMVSEAIRDNDWLTYIKIFGSKYVVNTNTNQELYFDSFKHDVFKDKFLHFIGGGSWK